MVDYSKIATAKTQRDLLEAQEMTSAEIEVSRKMGLVDPNRPVRVGVMSLAKATTGDTADLLKENGLTTANIISQKMEAPQNKNLGSFMKGMEKDFAGGPKYDQFLASVGAKVKANPNVIDQLGKELANERSMASFREAVKAHPNEMAKVISDYKPGQLASAMKPYGPAPIQAAASVAEPTTQRARVAHKDKQSTPSQPTTEPIKVAVAVDPVTTTATTPAVDLTPAAASVQASGQTPSSSNTVIPAAAGPSVAEQIIDQMAGVNQQNVKELVTPATVKLLANGMSEYAQSAFGVDEVTAKGFAERINDPKNPQLAQNIANNLQRHPEFVRELSNVMKNQQSGETPDGLKEMAKKEMTKVMENPELLASEKYVTSATKMMKGSGMMNGISSFLKNTFNIDTSGLMNSMSGMFQGIMQWFQDFMGAFTGGGVKDFLSQPSNSKLGMFDKLAAGIGHAFGVANNTYHSPYEKMGMGMEVIPAKDGTYFHTETKKNAEGHEVKKTVPNTIEVTTINNQTHKIVPTNGELEISQSGTGNYKIKLATDIKKDPATGVVKVSDSAEFYVNEAELKKLQDKIAEKRQEAGLTEPNQMQVARNAPAVEQKAAVIRNTPVDKDNGAVGNTVQTYPLPAQPEITVKPLSSADQDLRTMKTAALDQSTLGLMSGPTGA